MQLQHGGLYCCILFDLYIFFHEKKKRENHTRVDLHLLYCNCNFFHGCTLFIDLLWKYLYNRVVPISWISWLTQQNSYFLFICTVGNAKPRIHEPTTFCSPRKLISTYKCTFTVCIHFFLFLCSTFNDDIEGIELIFDLYLVNFLRQLKKRFKLSIMFLEYVIEF